MRWPVPLALLLAVPLAAAPARAEMPRGTYIEISPGEAEVVEPAAASSNIIYLDRCEGGCTVYPGYNDSRTNRSSIVGTTRHVTEFRHGEVMWDSIVRCVTAMYEPFDVVVTDQDPGDVHHFKAIVAGRPSEIGMSSGVGGVAPFSCGVINNAITFSFANIYGSAQAICEVVAQETAHAFGLDHQYLCKDPMTYLGGCGAKTFQDVNAECGEFEPRWCRCGGDTQNSVQRIMSVFGPSTPRPPEVTIVRPRPGARVRPGFPIEVKAEHPIAVELVEFFVNGAKVGETTIGPHVINAPQNLDEGGLVVEARATGHRGAVGTARIDVAIGEPCQRAAECGDAALTCVDGRCVPGPGSPGGLGESCAGPDECASGLCPGDADGNHFCVEECEVAANGCPGGFKCAPTAEGSDRGVCWPGGGGCQTAGGGAALPLVLAVFGCAVLLGRRRRRA